MPMVPSEMEIEKKEHQGKKYQRPDFGEKQIINRKELKPGLVVIKMPEGVFIRILTKPHKDKDGIRWIHVKFPNKEAESMSLAEVSIVPYPDGMWDKENWLSRS